MISQVLTKLKNSIQNSPPPLHSLNEDNSDICCDSILENPKLNKFCLKFLLFSFLEKYYKGNFQKDNCIHAEQVLPRK